MDVSHERVQHGRRRMVRLALCVAGALAGVSAAARAQTPAGTGGDSTHHHRWWPGDFGLSLGPGVGFQRYADRVSGRETALTAVGGFFRGSKLGPESKAGFVPTFNVTLFPTKVATIAAGDPTATVLGTIRLRPMMVGLGWFHPIGKTVSVRLTGLGGLSFNGLGAADDGKDKPQLPVASAPTAIANSGTWETAGKLWFSASPTISFLTGVSFIHARPRLTFADGSTRDWNADRIRLDAGVAFTLFRWHR